MIRARVDQDIQPMERLREGLEAVGDIHVGLGSTEAAVLDTLRDEELIVVTSRVPVTERVLEHVEIVAKIGTGLDSIDLGAARRLGVPVTYTPGVNALAVAEHTVGLLLATRRRIVETHEHLQSGGWRDEVEPGRQVHGTTIGIVGFGNVGRRVAALLAGFETETLAYDPYVDEIEAQPTGTRFVSLEELLRESDVVCVNAELTDETRGLLDAAAFARMKDDAVLVNTARGPIVDEAALIDALQNDELGGAGLDVYETEPVEDSPLLALDDVVTTPHVAAASMESRTAVIDRIVANVRALLSGEELPERYLAVPPDGPVTP